MASYFLSDIHLKPFSDPRMGALVGYLDHISNDAQRVFFLGDIFDFWMGGHDVWLKRYAPFVKAIELLRQRRVEVFFFEGNHDIHIDPFFAKLGVQVFVEPQIMELHGIRVRIEHGDLFNPDDRGYLFLRSFLRSRPLRATSILAPGGLVTAIADWGTQASHKRTSREGRRPEVVEDIKRRTREYVRKCASEHEFDLMVMGHTHVREDYEIMVNGRSVRFINLGSWFEPTPQVFILEDGQQGYEKILLSY